MNEKLSEKTCSVSKVQSDESPPFDQLLPTESKLNFSPTKTRPTTQDPEIFIEKAHKIPVIMNSPISTKSLSTGCKFTSSPIKRVAKQILTKLLLKYFNTVNPLIGTRNNKQMCDTGCFEG